MGTFIWYPDGDHTECDERFLELFGLPVGGTINLAKATSTLIHPDDSAGFREAVWTACDPADDGNLRTEIRVVYPNDSVHWLAIIAQAFFQGKPRHAARITGIAADITRRKQAELALKEADRRKDEFLAMLAHELRNPLAPVRNALQILRLTGGQGEAATAAMETIEGQIPHMVSLVDDLLDVSRISRGKIELRRERIELSALVSHAAETARPLYAKRGRELTVTLPAQPIYLNADPTRLAQIIDNLLNNAAKFTDEDGHVWLTAKRDRDEAVLRVRDDGIGITADACARIFEMFAQVDTSLERSQSSLGLGLTLVKSLVELHGGAVETCSGGLGQGTEFILRLPALAETPKPAPPPETTSAGEKEIVTGRRILVVDDYRDSADMLAMILKFADNEVRTAYDGLECLAAAESFRPEVVLLDIGMPKLNGYDTCRRIRQQSWGKRMLLITLTGWGQEEDKRRTAEAGFDTHVVKPVDPVVLTKLLAALLHERE